MGMNTKPRLYQRVAFNLIVAVVIGVCFGARQGVAQQQSTLGEWSALLGPTWPEFPVHAHVLPTGKVMIWPGDQGISGDNQQPRSWNPADRSVSTLTRVAGYDLFCSGHSFLADGRLFVAGGHIQNGVGVRNASIYNPFGNPPDWTALPLMNAGRWYPTVTVLANGDVLVVSGSIDGYSDNNTVPQVFQVGSGTWRNLQERAMDLYPQMFLAPNGKVFNSGPSWDTRYLDTAGSGKWSFWRLFPDRSIPRLRISGDVRPGKILVMGGGGGDCSAVQSVPTNTAMVIDLNQPSPTWREVDSMEFARRQLNATLLPDGNVLVTGGTSSCGFNDPAGAVHAAELWNPTTEQWTTLASSSGIPRIYHSTALLLPDARVLSMGGNVLGNPYPDTRTTEIYSPPYLFNALGQPAARPTITSAPEIVAYGQTFFVQTDDAAAITNGGKVTMLRLSSVTHSFNMSQYINTLSFSQATGGLNVVAPSGAAVVAPTPTVAPPGPYMLFILNGSGVPSVAKIVRVARLSSIEVTPVGPSISIGATQQFKATGKYSEGTLDGSPQEEDITSQVTWASSNTAMATINGSGLATGVSAGSPTISAALSLSGTVMTGSTTLTVQAAPAPTLNSIAVTPANPTIQTGATQQFTATGTYSNGSTQNITTQVTWASSSTTVATISGSVATGVSTGITTISAALSGKAGSTTLTVQAAPVATLSSIAVTPANPTIQTGATQQFTATGTYSDLSTQNITSQVTWASSSTTVATISGSVATGVSAGITTISAALSGKAGSTTLTVQAPLAITTNSLPDGKVNVAYSPVTLQASGGTPPYTTWLIASGSLPKGLSLNQTSGVISGTVTKPGSPSFTVRVTDAGSRAATKVFTIRVGKR